MAERDSALIIEISQNVKYLRETVGEFKETFDKHVEHDNKIAEDYIKPLWNKHQQNKGAAHLGALIYGCIGSVVTFCAAYLTGIVHK